jgi:hypothetical protein
MVFGWNVPVGVVIVMHKGNLSPVTSVMPLLYTGIITSFLKTLVFLQQSKIFLLYLSLI